MDGPLYFANAERLEYQVLDTVDRRGGLGTVLLGAAAISDVDADGAHALGRLRERLADRGVALHLATVRGPVRDLLDRAGVRHRSSMLPQVRGPPGSSPLQGRLPERTDPIVRRHRCRRRPLT